MIMRILLVTVLMAGTHREPRRPGRRTAARPTATMSVARDTRVVPPGQRAGPVHRVGLADVHGHVHRRGLAGASRSVTEPASAAHRSSAQIATVTGIPRSLRNTDTAFPSLGSLATDAQPATTTAMNTMGTANRAGRAPTTRSPRGRWRTPAD